MTVMDHGYFRALSFVLMIGLSARGGTAQSGSAAPTDERAETRVASGAAPRYIEREIYVPVLNAMPNGLDVVEIYADLPGRHPLALLTHGTAVKPAERLKVTPWAEYGQALWFARRGYVVLIVVRKGYGRSGGKQDSQLGGCNTRGSFREAGEAAAQDLIDVMRWAANRPEVDTNSIVSVGVSAGGFAQVALAAGPPPGLRAAISFAGGRGADGKEHNCDLDGIVHAFQSFGKDAAKRGSLPMLWIYSENDHYFPPAMAVRFDQAYRKGGGEDQFVMAPPNGDDGHHLYSHPDAWSETVSDFLAAHELLPIRGQVLPAPLVPEIPPPAGLHARGVEGWQRYLGDPPFRAFAMTGTGGWGFASGTFDQETADQQAIERCKKASGAEAGLCKVVARTPGIK